MKPAIDIDELERLLEDAKPCASGDDKQRWKNCTAGAAALNALPALIAASRERDEQRRELEAAQAALQEFSECSIAGCRAWDEKRLHKLWFSKTVRDVARLKGGA